MIIPYKIGNEKITGIGSEAFNFLRSGESKVEKIIITNGINYIANRAFARLSIKEVTIPGTVENIGEEAFDNCDKLEKVVIAEGVKYINDKAFYDCEKLQEISLPNTLTHIGSYSFANGETSSHSEKSTVVIPGGVEYIGDFAFCYSGATKIVCKEGVKSIGEGAFAGCYYLKEVILPDTLATIKDYAFYSSCFSKLINKDEETVRIVIPKNVENISEKAFIYCGASLDVDKDNKAYSSQDGVLFNKDKTELLRVPTLNEGSYAVPNSVKTIGKMAFYACGLLDEIILPEGLERIEEGGLCLYISYVMSSDMTDITIPNSVTYISENALSYQFKNIYFAPGNNPIPEGAPWGADNKVNIQKLEE